MNRNSCELESIGRSRSGSSIRATGRSVAGAGLAWVAIALGCDGVRPPAAEPSVDFALEEMTIAELQEAMGGGAWTSRALVEAYLERIEALDRNGPALRSMLDLNPEALGIADGLDAERREGRVRGPLHGIPIVLKDNIDTADEMTTTAGSLALEGYVAPRDAFIVERLREAGAVIIGKANLSEWANFRSTNSSSGWSGRGGQVRNPYVLDRSPCGSSSGTGTAVAANFAAAGVGTETDGSIVCPAGVAGLVGIKPTIGLVSRSGIIPIAYSQDTAGPMTRTVADAAVLLGVLAGEDPRDSTTIGNGSRFPADLSSSLDPDGLRGARIGVARERVTGYSPPADTLFERAIEVMRRAGAEIVDPTDIPFLGDYGDAEWTILLYEFRDGLNRYLTGLGETVPVRTLADLIDFNERNRDRSMPFFGQEILMMAEETRGDLEDDRYRDARRDAAVAAAGLDRVFAEHGLDAIVAPTGTPAWPIDLINGDHYKGSSSTAPAVAGYPHVTLPMGEVHGLPVGLSFIGAAWSEPTLIRLAYGFEQATRHRRPPRFAPTVSH